MDPNPHDRPSAEHINSKINQWKTILETENLTDEELDIKKKFIDANSIIKKLSLKFLSMMENKYCSSLIDVQEITKSLKVSTSVTNQIASSIPELPDNISDIV
ncbi:hypothetical protein F8M41_026001 [Gigaspora margarita]|uniref:Uncharacterized protein n=1 Tax=Gigaspora margarita TaxID=4874 RepID=A0A8H4ABD6_GIGMA|nr:hypothetical protein F8M41_026001 [Gigaspora margarita]